jgi:type II secretory pathway pseudopilin PulG
MSRINQKAFTLIELMLAMTFVSMLLIAIAMLTIQISNTYTKGITLRDVNQAGLAVSNDLHRSINASSAFDPTPGADSYVQQPTGGRLCLGNYSYVWNDGKGLNGDAAALSNKFVTPNGSPSSEKIHYVKVADLGKALCQPTNQADIDSDVSVSPVYEDIVLDQKVTEMLTAGDRDLAIQSFKIVSGSLAKPLYSISIVIGTNGEGQITGSDGDSCKPPAELDGDEDYCSINKFDIIARVGSKEGN